MPTTPVALVQANAGTGGPASTATVSLPAGTTAGNTLVLGVYWQRASAPTFTLPAGWLRANETYYSGAFGWLDLWYYPNVPAGVTSWALGFGASTYYAWQLAEFSGMQPAGVTDGLVQANVASDPSTVTLTTTAPDLLVGFAGMSDGFGSVGAVFTPPSGFSPTHAQATYTNYADAYMVWANAVGPGTYTYTQAGYASNPGQVVLVAFQVAAPVLAAVAVGGATAATVATVAHALQGAGAGGAQAAVAPLGHTVPLAATGAGSGAASAAVSSPPLGTTMAAAASAAASLLTPHALAGLAAGAGSTLCSLDARMLVGMSSGQGTAVAGLAVAHGIGGLASGNAALQGQLPALFSLNQVTYNPLTPLVAAYTVRVRTPGRTLLGQLSGYRKLSLVRRYNAVSDWAMEIDASEPLAAYLLTPQYGISVVRTVYNSLGKVVLNRVELAGKVTSIARNYAANTLTLNGKDDLYELARRQAWPVTTYPYYPAVLADGPLRLYKLADATTTAVDSSPAVQFGTYNTTPIQTANPMDVLPATGAQLTGATHVTVPTTGLPTGTHAWTLEAWCVPSFSTALTTAGYLFALGTPGVAGGGAYICQSSGSTPGWGIGAGGASDWQGQGTVQSGQLYHVVGVFDGVAYTLTVNGIVYGPFTPAATPALTAATATLGAANMGGGVYANPYYGSLYAAALYPAALTQTQIQTHYGLGVTRFAAAAYDVQYGPAETVMKHYVSVNAGPAALLERQVATLAVAPDTGAGARVNGNARFDRLVAPDGSGILQTLALAGGLGFYCRPVAGVLTFDTYTPVDRSASVIFSAALGNLLDFSYTRAAPDPETGGNTVVIAGSQQGTARVIQIVDDPPSVVTWGRVEYFQDDRTTLDIPTLQQHGATTLAASKETDTFSAVLTQIPQMVYGIDFDLGDTVTAIIDGSPYVDTIREIAITLDGNKEEVVTPTMGTPNAVLTRDAISRLRRQLIGQINRVQRTQIAT